MEYVNLVTGIRVDTHAVVSNYKEIYRIPIEGWPRAIGTSLDEAIVTETELERCRIIEICRKSIDDNKVQRTFIAVTREVQELLEYPFDILARRSEAAEASRSTCLFKLQTVQKELQNVDKKLAAINSLGVLGRIKFILTGKY